MKENRSASQILFGYLPEQTVDLKNGVWKVKRWRDPIINKNVDDSTIRNAIKSQVSAWLAENMDGGYWAALNSGAPLDVVQLDPNNGVEVEPFPKQWICRGCSRVHTEPDIKCICGHKGEPGQLFFVGYHDACGQIREPYIKKCNSHNQVAIRFPGTSSATEIIFYCPICNIEIRKGFGFSPCSCGQGNLSFQPHRSSSVYTPRAVVIVNPPSKEQIRAVAEAGGPPRALSWVINGMNGALDKAPNPIESLRRMLALQGLSEDKIELMLQVASSDPNVDTSDDDISFPDEYQRAAEDQAVTIALATMESRFQVSDLINEANLELVELYKNLYPSAIKTAALESVDFISKFPVLTGHYGYTRGKFDPGKTKLMPFRSKRGYCIYADLAETEALFIRLDPKKVAGWLENKGHDLPAWHDEKTARAAIISSAKIPDAWGNRQDSIGADLLELIHSYAHRFLRIAATFAGIDRNALSELLVPIHCGFFIYAAAKGDFVLGGLQAVFETELHNLLNAVVYDERRCPLDPGCSDAGGACVGCLHLGEPSCQYFNRYLSRSTLFDENGYLSYSYKK